MCKAMYLILANKYRITPM